MADQTELSVRDINANCRKGSSIYCKAENDKFSRRVYQARQRGGGKISVKVLINGQSKWIVPKAIWDVDK